MRRPRWPRVSAWYASSWPKCMHRRGLEPIDAEPGDGFDPHVHEALSHQPSDQPEGTIAAVWQRGYRLGSKVVRPVRVVVSSGPPLPTVRVAEPRHGEPLRHPGRPQGGEPGGDQEGLPQARPSVPSRRESRGRDARRSASSRSARPTTSCPIRRSASSTTPSARTSAPAPSLRAVRRALTSPVPVPTSIWAICSVGCSTAAARAGRARRSSAAAMSRPGSSCRSPTRSRV